MYSLVTQFLSSAKTDLLMLKIISQFELGMAMIINFTLFWLCKIIFNHQCMMILNDFETLFYQELKQDFSCCLMNVRILAKFLGFLLFQPYYGVETISQVITTETLKIRNRVSQPITVK